MKKILFITLVLNLVPWVGFAQSPISTTDLSSAFFRSSSGLGMAGAYRAVADSPQAVLYNPAGMTKNRGSLQAGVDYAYQEETSSHLYGVSVVDFQTSQQMAYGLSYHRNNPTIGGISGNVNQTMLAVAYPLGQVLSLGVTGKGYWINLNSPILQGPRGIDMDAAVMVRPFPLLSFGMTGYNLFRGGDVEEYPLMLGMGAALNLEPHIKLTADMVKNFNTTAIKTTNYHMGAQVRMGETAYLRGGFAFDQVANNNYYSVGAALTGPRVDLLFTFSQRLNPTSETYAATLNFKM